MRALPLIRILMRLSITVLLVLGILFWTGHAYALVQVHMAFGLVFVLGLWALAGIAAGRGAPLPAVLAAIVLGLAVLALGMTQTRLLPGGYHWLIRLLHLALGMAAMGIAERLGRGVAGPAAAAPGAAKAT
ncbi:MAG TPA: hypothetical protein VFA75_09720 [Nevskia sp.]|nr:hypothetical protein [Nevskia sp.]